MVVAGELSVQRAVETALSRNLSLIADAEMLTIAQANLAQAGLYANPVLSQNSGFLFPVNHGLGRPSWDINVSQVVNTFLVHGPKVAAAKAQREQAGIDRASAAFSLAMQVERRYWELVHVERSRKVTARIIATYEAGLRAAQARAQAGVVPTSEVNRARLAALDARRQTRHLESQAASTRRELNFLMGAAEPADWTLPADVVGSARPPAAWPDDQTLETMGLAYRLDVERSEYDSQLAAAQLTLAHRGRFPQLNVGVDRAVDSAGAVSIGPFFSLTLPIFDTGAVAVDLAEDQVRLADKMYIAKTAQVRDDVRAAAAAARLVQEDVEFYRREAIPQQEENARLAQEAFSQGVTDLDSLLNVLRDYAGALQSAEDAERSLDDARIDLEQATGLLTDRMDDGARERASKLVEEARARTTPQASSPARKYIRTDDGSEGGR
jgi:outer membrane protein TolC